MKLARRRNQYIGKIFRASVLLGIAAVVLAGCQGAPSASMPPGLIGGLQRQADCSLTYFDFSYAPSSTALSVTPNVIIPHYEQTLHDSALLGTTPDKFPAGCVDPNRGIASRPFLFLGTGKNGRELVAVVGTPGVVTSGLKSDATYTQPATLETPIKSISLVSGDLNKDGNADLISINSNALQSSVTVFLGKDDGSYQPGVDYALPGATAQYGVLDDLNGDGILDLLVSSDSPTFSFSIFLGNGDGTFQPPRTFTPDNGNLHFNDAFITADVNGDGARDIVTAQGQVFLGTGDGITFTSMAQAAFPPLKMAGNDFAPSIVAADFNHDGKVDLATDDGQAIRTFRGNGDGTFTAGPQYSAIANYGFLTATDLDGDGNIDLWTGNGGNGMYSGDALLPSAGYALMGSGDGTFQGTPGLPAAHFLANTATAVKSISDSSKGNAGVTFHAAVSSIAMGTITGTVTFFDGSNQIASPVEVSGGSGEISTSTLMPGVHSITAKYSGDSNFAPSASPALSNAASSGVTISIGSPTPSSLSVVSGHTSAPFTVLVTSLISTSQTVTFSCAGLPAQLQCNFPSTPVTLAANSSASVPITIGPTSSALVAPPRRLSPPSDWTNAQKALVLTLFSIMLILAGTRQRKAGWAVCACMMLLALTSLAGCGGSDSTPAKYAVTVSALGSGGTPVEAQPTLTLTVTPN